MPLAGIVYLAVFLLIKGLSEAEMEVLKNVPVQLSIFRKITGRKP